ncbi:MAG: hypothetical protein ACT4PV_03140 [Planctomycetaceae bacterium]
MRKFPSVAVLGGAGLVGYQVCRRLLLDGVCDRLAIVSLGRQEVRDAVAELRREFPSADLEGWFGDVFARGELGDAAGTASAATGSRADAAGRRALLRDIYESFDEAREHSALVAFLRGFRPAAVVDCINTATAISYQDVPTAAKRLMAGFGLRGASSPAPLPRIQEEVEELLVSIEIPQLVLHVRLLHAALKEVGCEVYLKVGTTGTGGMGLNIPYTHGEEKPSPTLMAKTAVAFAQTGLLFLAARSEGAPVMKELKPAAMIGYREVAVQEVPGYVWEKQGGKYVKRKGVPRPLYEAKRASLGEPLETAPDAAGYATRREGGGGRGGGASGGRTIKLACVSTGENGWFARGEFEAITALDQMEMITPEEIARSAVQELAGRSTGRDVLAALDASILAPTYKGGLVRSVAVDLLAQLDGIGSVPSVALGDLGPPQLSKYLFELYLARAAFGSLPATAAGLRAADAGATLAALLDRTPDLRDAVVSVGIAVLLPDGETILRGPELKIPGYDPTAAPRRATPEEIDAYARRGWVDLRRASLERWAGRLERLVASQRGGSAGASDAMSREAYGRDDFRIGEVVAWVFANEPEYRGFRIK